MWRVQEWTGLGYWAGVVAAIAKPGPAGLLIGWGITAAVALFTG